MHAVHVVFAAVMAWMPSNHWPTTRKATGERMASRIHAIPAPPSAYMQRALEAAKATPQVDVDVGGYQDETVPSRTL